MDDICEFLSKLNVSKEINIEDDNNKDKLYKNKGVGAGGKNTNIKGKLFEDITDSESFLANLEFIKILINKTKYGYYFFKKTEDKEIIFIKQGGLKVYMKKFYDIDLFRCPDEAYIIKEKDSICIKIIEKKEQSVEGSVETKLWAGTGLKREYEILLGSKFNVEYIFCVSSYLKEKFLSESLKYKTLLVILKESNINIFYGEDENYCNDIITHCFK